MSPRFQGLSVESEAQQGCLLPRVSLPFRGRGAPGSSPSPPARPGPCPSAPCLCIEALGGHHIPRVLASRRQWKRPPQLRVPHPTLPVMEAAQAAAAAGSGVRRPVGSPAAPCAQNLPQVLQFLLRAPRASALGPAESVVPKVQLADVGIGGRGRARARAPWDREGPEGPGPSWGCRHCGALPGFPHYGLSPPVHSHRPRDAGFPLSGSPQEIDPTNQGVPCRPHSPCTELCHSPDPTFHSVWGLGDAWDPSRGARECGGVGSGWDPPQAAASQVLALQASPGGSLLGYPNSQASVLQAELWGAPLAQKAGGGHDAVGPAGPQVEGVLAQLARLVGACWEAGFTCSSPASPTVQPVLPSGETFPPVLAGITVPPLV